VGGGLLAAGGIWLRHGGSGNIAQASSAKAALSYRRRKWRRNQRHVAEKISNNGEKANVGGKHKRIEA